MVRLHFVIVNHNLVWREQIVWSHLCKHRKCITSQSIGWIMPQQITIAREEWGIYRFRTTILLISRQTDSSSHLGNKKLIGDKRWMCQKRLDWRVKEECGFRWANGDRVHGCNEHLNLKLRCGQWLTACVECKNKCELRKSFGEMATSWMWM